MAQQRYYPIFADVRGRRCLIIGGGAIARRKARSLLRHGAAVTLVTPAPAPALLAAAKTGQIRLVARRFRQTDVKGAWLVVAATDDEQVNRDVATAAQRHHIWANIVDRTALCSFIAPSVLQRNGLTVAVSTAGKSPSLAKHLRRALEDMVDRGYVPMLRLLSGVRADARERLPSYRERQRYFDQIMEGRVFRAVQAGHYRKAQAAAQRMLEAQEKAR